MSNTHKKFKNVVLTDKVIINGQTGYNLELDGDKKCVTAEEAIMCVKLAEKTNASIVEDKFLRLKSGTLNVIDKSAGKTYDVDKTVKKLQEKRKAGNSFQIKLKNGIELTIADQSTPHEAGWFIYIGCELVSGDRTIQDTAAIICQLAEDSRKNIIKEFGLGYLPEYADG